MTGDEIERLLQSQKICRMAMNDTPQPYIIALDYVYIDGDLYFHFADYGRKMELIKKNPNVSIELDNFCEGATSFETITLMGRLEKVTSPEEKKKAAEALFSSANVRGGPGNLAVRHGFESLDLKTLVSPRSALYRLDAQGFVALKTSGR